MNKLLIIVLLLFGQSAFGRWDLVGSMTVPISCGYFFDGENGLIGSGHFAFANSGYVPNDPVRIWRTTNGGNTWIPCNVPNITGRVTSIYMKDALVGYAGLFSHSSSILKTTDGGKNWQDNTFANLSPSSCIYATPFALVSTMWEQANFGAQKAGGISVDDGRTMSYVFDGFNINNLNGVDFLDDINGVVTPGPGNPNPNCFFTTDGGITWQQGGLLDESWGIYAAKGQNIYITLAEGISTNDQTMVRVSTNSGRTWQTRHTFPNNPGDPGFTGHIAGKATTVYVQTTSDGLRRSDNLGLSWRDVGGPDKVRDTRFVVTGCRGEVVFAFDDEGGIWRTTDGGDGTLSGGTGGNGALSMSVDSILISTLYCQPEFGYVTLSVPPCGMFTVDSVYIISQQNEFTTDSTKQFSVVDGSSVTVPVRFQYGSAATRTGVLHFKGIIGGRQIDTTIILIGKNATAPEPFVGLITSVPAGDTTHIPIHLTPTVDTFTIKRYRLHVSYNTDLLSCEDFDIIGTLSNPIISHQIINDANGAELICELRNPITEKSDLSIPLVRLVMRTYVTTTLASSIRLDTLSVTTQAPLPLCTIPVKQYQAKYECGDSMLVQLMRDGSIPELSFIKPNPVVGGEMIAGVTMPKEVPVNFEIVDIQGNVVLKLPERSLGEGHHEVHFNTSALPSGSYMVSLRSGSTILASRKVFIQK